ncbi:MAG: site-2 protease family protein [Deltaproteobacteria bacterium]|nr:site-2 protease family protein [Deltaproteobacteria bacterium]
MNWSWKIFTLFNIPVRLHYSMVIIPFISFSMLPGSGFINLLIATALAVLLFASVLAHEFGHSLTARRYGIRTADIVLTPIGGMARMESIPPEPVKEITISIAGPLVSFAIAGGSYLLITLSPFMAIVPHIVFIAADILFQLNLMLGLFNLLPALPMDGGRIFRGLLALKFSHLKATSIASQTGRFLAIGGGIYGFIQHSWSLVFIAFFVYSSAGRELRAAQIAESLKNRPATSPFSNPMWSSRINFNHTPYSEYRDWTNKTPDSDVTVIKGGKVEIVDKNDSSK